MQKQKRFFMILCTALITAFILQICGPAVYAAPMQAREAAEGQKKGSLADNDLTMEELTADCYMGSTGLLKELKKTEEWPSEKLLAAAEETHLKTWITVDKVIHLPTDPTQWLDADKKKLDYYTAILISLFLDEGDKYDSSAYDQYTKYLSSDNKTFQKLLKFSENARKVSQLDAGQKGELSKTMKEYLSEDAGADWPVTDFVDDLINVTDKVEDAVQLAVELKSMQKAGEKYKILVEELSKETEDEILSMALNQVSAAMNSAFQGVLGGITSGAVDIGLWGAKKVIKEAYKETVLNALPVELSLALQFGTAAGDAVTSLLFANGSTEENLKKLECIGTLGRTMISASDRFAEQYQNNKKSGTKQARQDSAVLYIRSIESLYSLRKLSCDYAETFADKALDGTTFEKLLRILIPQKNKDYKDFLDALVIDKQKVLEEEKYLVLAPYNAIALSYPDEYASMVIDGLSVEEYINKIIDDYIEKSKEVPDKYAPEGTAKAAEKKKSGTVKTDSEKLMDDFMFRDGPAYDRQGNALYLKDLQDESKGPVYAVGPRVDLDNDGERELVLSGGFYGGMFLDAKDGKLTVFEEGFGTAGVLGYGYYEGKWVVCHKDTSHTGRNEYDFKVYNGPDTIEKTFTLLAEYWDAADPNGYDNNSTFTFKGETITRKEYEDLLREIFSKGDPSYASIRHLPDAPEEQNEENDSPVLSLADVVRQYESDYGKLEFKTAGAGTAAYSYYTGVFLLKLLDFDRDGKYELIIGYASEDGTAHISSPKLDVWQMKNGSAVCVYEGAEIRHGDIGSRCEFLEWDGRSELVTGFDGGDIGLHFLTLENGSFQEKTSLQYGFTGTDYQWTVNGEIVSEADGMKIYDSVRNNKNKYYGTVSKDLGQSEDSIREDLEAGYKAIGM